MTSKKAPPDVAASAAEFVAAFERSIQELENMEDLMQFVVVFPDTTPLRTDGIEVRITGPKIFSVAFSADARRIAQGINRKFAAANSDQRVRVDFAATWKPQRIDALRAMIASIGEHVNIYVQSSQ